MSMVKIRSEKSGLHFFNRKNGLHILFDEIQVLAKDCSIAPRHLSVALTNKCNFNCDYCYNIKNDETLTSQFVENIAKIVDDLGTLEITFGGGEPLLHPEIADICEWIWGNTDLGISITTNGFLLNDEIIGKLVNNISFLRISIDSIEPDYSIFKGHSLSIILENIKKIKGRIPFGINTIVRPNRVDVLKDVIALSIKINASNLLIIPEHKNGMFLLTDNDWNLLNGIIDDYKQHLDLLLTYDASSFLNQKVIEIECNEEFLFAHVSADGKLKRNSFDDVGFKLNSPDSIIKELKKINKRNVI